jgi:hypothetical protein
MDLQRFNLLCLVVYLFMMMNKTHLLIVSSITSGCSISKINWKQKRSLIII